MKKLLVIIALIVGILIFLTSQEDQRQRQPPPQKEEIASETQKRRAPPPPPPLPGAQQQTRRIAPAPPSLPTAAGSDPIVARLGESAQKAGVELIDVQNAPPGALVTVRWSSDRMDLGGVFIDQALRDGVIRDFDIPTRDQQSIHYVDGRRVQTASFNVRF